MCIANFSWSLRTAESGQGKMKSGTGFLSLKKIFYSLIHKPAYLYI